MSEEGFSTSSNSEQYHSSYTIETAARITGLERHFIAVCCQRGWVSPCAEPGEAGWIFDDDALRRLRLIEQLQSTGVSDPTALGVIFHLINELEQLRAEVRRLRQK